MIETVTPHNLDAERAVLGSMLVRSDADIGGLAAVDFFRDAHARIFAAIAALKQRHEPVDLLTLKQQLQRTGDLDDVGGPAYLAFLADGVPVSVNAPYYATIVRQCAHARRLIRVASDAIEAFANDPTAIGNGHGMRFVDAVRSEIEAAHALTAGAPDVRIGLPLPVLAARQADAFTRDMAIDGLLALGEIALVFGAPRSMKSLEILSMCVAAAVGGHLFGLPQFRAEQRRRVLYLTNEDSEAHSVDRAVRIVHGAGVDELPDNLLLQCGGNALDSPDYQRRLIETCKAEAIELLAIEPLRTMTIAVDQGPRELQPLATFLRQRLIGETGVALVLGHHDTKPLAGVSETRRKAQQVSGGGLFSIAESPMHSSSLDDRTVILTPDAFKHQDTPAPIILRLQLEPGVIRLVGEVSDGRTTDAVAIHTKILDYLRDSPGQTTKAVAGGLRMRKEAVTVALQELLAGDRIDCVEEGRARKWFGKAV